MTDQPKPPMTDERRRKIEEHLEVRGSRMGFATRTALSETLAELALVEGERDGAVAVQDALQVAYTQLRKDSYGEGEEPDSLIEPSDHERAGLPQCTRTYLAGLEQECSDFLTQRNVYKAENERLKLDLKDVEVERDHHWAWLVEARRELDELRAAVEPALTELGEMASCDCKCDDSVGLTCSPCSARLAASGIRKVLAACKEADGVATSLICGCGQRIDLMLTKDRTAADIGNAQGWAFDTERLWQCPACAAKGRGG